MLGLKDMKILGRMVAIYQRGRFGLEGMIGRGQYSEVGSGDSVPRKEMGFSSWSGVGAKMVVGPRAMPSARRLVCTILSVSMNIGEALHKNSAFPHVHPLPDSPRSNGACKHTKIFWLRYSVVSFAEEVLLAVSMAPCLNRIST